MGTAYLQVVAFSYQDCQDRYFCPCESLLFEKKNVKVIYRPRIVSEAAVQIGDSCSSVQHIEIFVVCFVIISWFLFPCQSVIARRLSPQSRLQLRLLITRAGKRRRIDTPSPARSLAGLPAYRSIVLCSLVDLLPPSAAFLLPLTPFANYRLVHVFLVRLSFFARVSIASASRDNLFHPLLYLPYPCGGYGKGIPLQKRSPFTQTLE